MDMVLLIIPALLFAVVFVVVWRYPDAELLLLTRLGVPRLEALEKIVQKRHGFCKVAGKLYIAEPSLIVHVLVKNPKNYRKGGTEDSGFLENSPLASSFLASQEKQPPLRVVMANALSTSEVSKRLRAFGVVSERLGQSWRKDAENKRPINATMDCLRLAIDVVGLSLFDVDFGACRRGVESQKASAQAAYEGTEELVHALELVLRDTFALNRYQHHSPEFAHAVKLIDEHMTRFISKRQTELRARENGPQEEADEKQTESAPCMLDSMLRKADELNLPASEVLDTAKLMLFAGSETTGTALSIALHLAACHPQLQQTLRDEANAKLPSTAADLNAGVVKELRQADVFLRESLRLFPAPFISRMSVEADQCGQYSIPAKVLMCLSLR